MNLLVWAFIEAPLILLGILLGTIRGIHVFHVTLGFGPPLAFAEVGGTLLRIRAMPLGLWASYVPSSNLADNMNPLPPPGRHLWQDVARGERVVFAFLRPITLTLLAAFVLGVDRTNGTMASFWPALVSGALDPLGRGTANLASVLAATRHAPPIEFAGLLWASVGAWNWGVMLTPHGGSTLMQALVVGRKEPEFLRTGLVLFLVTLAGLAGAYVLAFVNYLGWLHV